MSAPTPATVRALAALTPRDLAYLRVVAERDDARGDDPSFDEGLSSRGINSRMPSQLRCPLREIDPVLTALIELGLLRRYRHKPPGGASSKRYRITNLGRQALAEHTGRRRG